MPHHRAQTWTRLGYGVYRPTSTDDWSATLAAWAEVLPRSAVFTGLSAARLHGLWLPDLPAETPVFADVPTHRTHSTRAGVRICRPSAAPAFEVRRGLLIATVPECIAASARELSVLDLVVLIDSALHAELLTQTSLDSMLGRRQRGGPRLRQALLLADGRSESAWETLLRLIHVCADVEVGPQHWIHDDRGQIGRADLHILGTQTIHEYDGLHHRTPAGQRKDLERDRRLMAAGWKRRGYTAVDVARRPTTIMRDAAGEVGGHVTRAHIARWETLWSASLFSRTGSEAAIARWAPRTGGTLRGSM